MDEDLARVLITGGTVASRELLRLHELVFEHLPEERELQFGIASALAEVGLKVMKPAYDDYPELEAEVERRIAKYGVAT